MARAFVQGPESEARLRLLVARHFEFVWRSARRFGVSESDADDAAQEVFVVLAKRLHEVGEAQERSFLFNTVVRVASTRRRSVRRHPEDASDALDERASAAPDPERMEERTRAHAELQRILERMPDEQRAVFVLYELEELSAPEIAELLGIPVGTVSSRLRAARQVFAEGAERLQAREGGAHVVARR